MSPERAAALGVSRGRAEDSAGAGVVEATVPPATISSDGRVLPEPLEPATIAWVDRIRPHLHRAAESIIAAGHDLNAAKKAVRHGQFGALVMELGLSSTQAQRFMRVARNTVLSNAAHAPHLPPAYTTLAALARLPVAVVEEAIKDGRINPSMRRDDVKELAPPATEMTCGEGLSEERSRELTEKIVTSMHTVGQYVQQIIGTVPAEHALSALRVFHEVADHGGLAPLDFWEACYFVAREADDPDFVRPTPDEPQTWPMKAVEAAEQRQANL